MWLWQQQTEMLRRIFLPQTAAEWRWFNFLKVHTSVHWRLTLPIFREPEFAAISLKFLLFIAHCTSEYCKQMFLIFFYCWNNECLTYLSRFDADKNILQHFYNFVTSSFEPLYCSNPVRPCIGRKTTENWLDMLLQN